MVYNPVDAGLNWVTDRFGIDAFTLRFALCLLGSYPLNAVLKRLPENRRSLKCYYIIGISMLYLFGVLNLASGFRTLLISAMFTYWSARFYHSSFMPYLNFVFVMGHLSWNHIGAQFFVTQSPRDAANAIDITSAQMVLAMKLTSFAWSVHDGMYLGKADFEQLTEYQKSRAVKRFPSLLQFMAYVFFYPTLLTGPSFDYSDFDSWLNCEMFKDLPESEKTDRRYHPGKKRAIPKNGHLAFWKVTQGIFWIVFRGYLSRFINVDFMLDKVWFMSKSFVYRIHYMFLLGLVARMKYYAAWTIAEGACILCGLGYNGYDAKTKKIKWNRVQNIDIWNVEMAQSTRQCLEAWNMNTNKWLKYYVYLRVTKKGKKPGFRSTLFTFTTSAFWHGVNPGYYLTFGTGALYQTCGKFYRRNFRPMFLKADGKTPTRAKWIYDLLGSYVIKLSFGYLVQPFLVLGFRDSIQAWKSVYFYGHIIVAVSFFLFRGPCAKSVVAWCKSMQPAAVAQSKQSKVESDIAVNAGSLGSVIKEKMEHENRGATPNNAEDKSMTYGIPSINFDELENAKEDWNEFLGEYNTWKERKGFEVEEANLLQAFEDFKTEIKNVAQDNNARRMSFSSYSPKPIESHDNDKKNE
ncbi:lysophospholipid acyltransferase KNAG_0M01010 [Huiozyma naganishii CBS 8797]|uniref:Uncharacterized protein n=1 Tax=Huiozyma naganishii (strain ATCC MYA-139 / BCRC 22969 / CBS 8797 / KCTC 17520 / NBRC 10181 / NCYC 3082 / Yp74L-3) TaxID=1071383 RepID=J7SAQ8_HUIN7|nr:hypothetical protein KNAG_0M01010 [Kazachstania naganishii CBS 8797]CCK72954.1 hypothetical protein KNAG_0M01010 [Kazachstania naganishii CBS 8797]